MNNRILITGIEKCKNANLLSGVLLEPIVENDFRKDVFTAYLVSDRVREIVCELPVPVGGIGSSSEGAVTASKSRLVGTCVERVGLQTFGAILSDVASNRIKLITVSDVSDARFPALFSTDRPVQPIATMARVSLEIAEISDLPEMKAFMVQELRTDQKEYHQNVEKERSCRQLVPWDRRDCKQQLNCGDDLGSMNLRL